MKCWGCEKLFENRSKYYLVTDVMNKGSFRELRKFKELFKTLVHSGSIGQSGHCTQQSTMYFFMALTELLR